LISSQIGLPLQTEPSPYDTWKMIHRSLYSKVTFLFKASAAKSSFNVFTNWPSVANRTIARLAFLRAIREVGAGWTPHLINFIAVHAHFKVLAIVWVFEDIDALGAATVSWCHRFRSLALTLGIGIGTPTNWPFSTCHSIIEVALNQVRVIKSIFNRSRAIVFVRSVSAFAIYVVVTIVEVGEVSPRAGAPSFGHRGAGVAGV